MGGLLGGGFGLSKDDVDEAGFAKRKGGRILNRPLRDLLLVRR